MRLTFVKDPFQNIVYAQMCTLSIQIFKYSNKMCMHTQNQPYTKCKKHRKCVNYKGGDLVYFMKDKRIFPHWYGTGNLSWEDGKAHANLSMYQNNWNNTWHTGPFAKRNELLNSSAYACCKIASSPSTFFLSVLMIESINCILSFKWCSFSWA